MLTSCINHVGSFECGPCPDGFSGTGAAGCVDRNECDDDPCDPLTQCVNLEGSFKCTDCPVGYMGSGLEGCVDVNECTAASRFSNVLAYYTPSFGEIQDELAELDSNVAISSPDYISNGGCTQVRQAALTAPASAYEGSEYTACDSHSVCSNSPAGSFTCSSCASGYYGTGYEMTVFSQNVAHLGSGCYDINECASSPCQNGALCADSLTRQAQGPRDALHRKPGRQGARAVAPLPVWWLLWRAWFCRKGDVAEGSANRMGRRRTGQSRS